MKLYIDTDKEKGVYFWINNKYGQEQEKINYSDLNDNFVKNFFNKYDIDFIEIDLRGFGIAVWDNIVKFFERYKIKYYIINKDPEYYTISIKNMSFKGEEETQV